MRQIRDRQMVRSRASAPACVRSLADGRVCGKRLKSKLEYTNIAYALLPREFTFAEFEELYSPILGRPLDWRNFRRRILAMGLLKRLPHTRRGPHRPAALYSFANQSLRFIEML